jgi:hypothetical protein
LSAAAGWVASHSVGVRGAFCGVVMGEVFFIYQLNLSPFCVCMLFILLF